MKFLVTITASLFLLACKKENKAISVETNTDNRWEWVFSEGGIGGAHIDPSTPFIYLSLNKDSTWSVEVGSQLVQHGFYSISGSPSYRFIDFNSKVGVGNLYLLPTERILGMTADSLQLIDDGITDGFQHYFRKVLRGEKAN